MDRKKNLSDPFHAKLIGLRAIREKCPHFDEWIARLEKLIPLAGTTPPDMPLHAAPGGV